MEIDAALERVRREVVESYAHGSRLYAELADRAPLEAIVAFLRWDAHQPPFSRYLRLWLDKVPASLRAPLSAHVAVEEGERHSELFEEMMSALARACPAPPPAFDRTRLADLNYTFSPECAAERTPEFFAGGFFATEVMSAKRCGQLLRGLRRHGVPEAPLEYLRLHCDGDERHWREVRDQFLRPLLAAGPDAAARIEEGVRDRLERSERWLRWYERERLG